MIQPIAAALVVALFAAALPATAQEGGEGGKGGWIAGNGGNGGGGAGQAERTRNHGGGPRS